jgi:hypothetical protein
MTCQNRLACAWIGAHPVQRRVSSSVLGRYVDPGIPPFLEIFAVVDPLTRTLNFVREVIGLALYSKYGPKDP